MLATDRGQISERGNTRGRKFRLSRGDSRIGGTLTPCEPKFFERVHGMGKAIEVTRLDRSAAELRALAVKTENGDMVRRLLGIALLLDGWSRGEAATASGMNRQTLCDWVHRYNSGDVAGLATASRSGRPPALSDAQMGIEGVGNPRP